MVLCDMHNQPNAIKFKKCRAFWIRDQLALVNPLMPKHTPIIFRRKFLSSDISLDGNLDEEVGRDHRGNQNERRVQVRITTSPTV